MISLKKSTSSSIWSILPERLILMSSTLKDYIESDAYIADSDRIQFQILTLDIIGLKDDLHCGKAYLEFIESPENRNILCKYLQLQLNHISKIKKEFYEFQQSHDLITSPMLDPKTPTMSPNNKSNLSEEHIQEFSSPLKLEGHHNSKMAFLDSIRFFISKVQCQKECYKDLYSQRGNASEYLSTSLSKIKSQLPDTTYTLERLCEIVRTSLQELRAKIQVVVIPEKSITKLEILNQFKRRYNKIKTHPMIMFMVRLVNLSLNTILQINFVVMLLFTVQNSQGTQNLLLLIYKGNQQLSIAPQRHLVNLNIHLSDSIIFLFLNRNMGSAQEFIDRIELESDVRGRMRKQSDPTLEFTPQKKPENKTGASQTLPKDENSHSQQLLFELDSEITKDNSSIDDDSSSIFQSQRSLPIQQQNQRPQVQSEDIVRDSNSKKREVPNETGNLIEQNKSISIIQTTQSNSAKTELKKDINQSKINRLSDNNQNKSTIIDMNESSQSNQNSPSKLRYKSQSFRQMEQQSSIISQGSFIEGEMEFDKQHQKYKQEREAVEKKCICTIF